MRFGKRNKFNVSPKEQRTYRGRVYASKANWKQAVLLDEQSASGQIAWFPEVSVTLDRNGEAYLWKVDFVQVGLFDASLSCAIEIKGAGLMTRKALNAKGEVVTRPYGQKAYEWNRIRKLWRQSGPMILVVKDRNLRVVERIVPEWMERATVGAEAV